MSGVFGAAVNEQQGGSTKMARPLVTLEADRFALAVSGNTPFGATHDLLNRFHRAWRNNLLGANRPPTRSRNSLHWCTIWV
jgi:hypothetical protein